MTSRGTLTTCSPPCAISCTAGKIPLDCLYSLPLGIFAKPEHVKKYMKQENHALYDTYFDRVSGPAFYGGVCFHYNNAPGCISRFKIRKMQLDAEEVCSKYAKGSDMPYDVVRNLADKAFVIVDDPFIAELGVFGLHHYNRMIGSADANAYITEGEFDAIAVMASQLREGRDDFMIFAIGGNGNSGLSFLRELGIRTLWSFRTRRTKMAMTSPSVFSSTKRTS